MFDDDYEEKSEIELLREQNIKERDAFVSKTNLRKHKAKITFFFTVCNIFR